MAIVAIALFSYSSDHTTMIILAVAYTMALCVTVIPLSIGHKPKVSMEDVCQKIAFDYSLTKRECEIFIYLALGRNRPYIQEKLHLAEGTVRTHSSHIYEKLNVHTRQEMLDLIELYTKK